MAKDKTAGATKVAPVGTRRAYGLADQSTGFWDQETGVKVLRDQVVEIDMAKRVGKLTTGAIRAGRLIEVNLKPSEPAKAEGREQEGDALSAEK